MPASITRAMEEDGPTLLLPRNSAIMISFFYCTVNHTRHGEEINGWHFGLSLPNDVLNSSSASFSSQEQAFRVPMCAPYGKFQFNLVMIHKLVPEAQIV
eukprot:scaffold5017_cov56-Attheya_sp.AAC.3